MEQRRDEYGNPLGKTTEEGYTGTAGYPATTPGTAGYGTGGAYGTGMTGHGVEEVGAGHGVSGVLHRSGSSSSSSSSEDDGQGGRRKKKGLKEKIKEKLPGTHKKVGDTEYDATGQPVHTGEKKGIMEKIKDKLPGQHH